MNSREIILTVEQVIKRKFWIISPLIVYLNVLGRQALQADPPSIRYNMLFVHSSRIYQVVNMIVRGNLRFPEPSSRGLY